MNSTGRLNTYVQWTILFFCFIVLSTILMLTRVHLEPTPIWDYTGVYQKFAAQVFQGGQPYIDVWDNKPPLFHFINILLYSFGNHYLNWLSLLVVSNAAAALLLTKYIKRTISFPCAIIAGIVYILILYPGRGYVVNPRQPANVLIMVALLTRNPAISGGAIAGAGLLSQYSVVASLPVVYQQWQRVDISRLKIWISWYIGAGLSVAATIYASLAWVWSPPVTEGALLETMLDPQRVPPQAQGQKSPPYAWNTPINWASRQVTHIAHFFPTFAVGASAVSESTMSRTLTIGALSFSPFILLAWGGRYYIPVLLFTSGLFAIGLSKMNIFADK